MRTDDRSNRHTSSSKALFGVDLHDFTEKEASSSLVELASEFGISIEDVQKLKQQLSRK